MAQSHGINSVLTITKWTDNDTTLSTNLTAINFGDLDADVAETSTMGDTWREYIAGLKNGTFDVEGIHDTTPGTLLPAMLGGTAAPFTYAPQGTASGNVKITGRCILTGYSAPSGINDAVTFAASFQMSGAGTIGAY